jgi:hypothetical protein
MRTHIHIYINIEVHRMLNFPCSYLSIFLVVICILLLGSLSKISFHAYRGIKAMIHSCQSKQQQQTMQ